MHIYGSGFSSNTRITSDSSSKRVRFSDLASSISNSDSESIDSRSTPSTPSLTDTSLPPSPTDSYFLPTQGLLYQQINPLLVLNQVTRPAIQFDASSSPLTSFTCAGYNLGISAASTVTRDLLLSEPITNPPTRRLVLLCDTLPWSIAVEPRSLGNSKKSSKKRRTLIPHWQSQPQAQEQFVTLADLITCIQENLQRPVTPAEYATFTKNFKKQVGEHFYRRLDAIRNASEMEDVKRVGVKRVDALLGKTWFMGLRVCADWTGTGDAPLLLSLK